jgi:AraC-like DNA-binding protein
MQSRLVDQRLVKVIQIIQERPSSSVHDLAQEVNLSVSRLQHLAQDHMGIPLRHIASYYRILTATGLLSDTFLTIKEISNRIGYQHCSSFIRDFKKRTGVSPAAWRATKMGTKLPASLTRPLLNRGLFAFHEPPDEAKATSTRILPSRE